ncbi:MAG TPA: hypothetical protein VF609_01050 [Flavisolibacter sp.]|jgi:hypothetical protein
MDKKTKHPENWNSVWLIGVKSEDMLPVWFFLVLIAVICYLFYITRTTEEDIVMMSKNQLKRLQYWVRENAPTK